MKLLAKLLLLGVITFPVFFFWRRAAPAPAPASVPAPAAPEVSARTNLTGWLPRPVNPLAHTLAQLRWKLQQWRAARAEHPDDATDGDRLMQEMLALVTDDNVAAIVQSLSAADLNTPFGGAALLHWMQVDPGLVTRWLAARPDATEGETLAVADDWVSHRAGLQDCLDQLPDTAWKQNFLSDLGSEMSVKDPAAAVKLAQQMNPGDARLNLFRTVACNWVATDPNAAFQWVAGVTDSTLREPLIVATMQSYALTDPAQAATWLVSSVNSDEAVKEATLNILKTWAAQDPAQAAAWVSQFPEGAVKAAAVSIVAGYWQHTDRDAAIAWVQAPPAAPAN
jgi:hypothetical protein